MKRIILSVVCVIMATLQSMADTRVAILLLHNGNGTTFEFTQLQDAVDAAESGDTLLLSKGAFTLSNTLTINKGVSIIGEGQGTEIKGSINVSIPNVVVSQDELGNPVTEMPSISATMFDALKIRGNVTISNNLSGFKMRKCWVTGEFTPSGVLYNALIDRCVINTFYPRAPKSINIMNCHIGLIRSSSDITNNSEIVYVNCAIRNLLFHPSSGLAKATYINCIISYTSSEASLIKSSTFINSLYTSAVQNIFSTDANYINTIENCYVGGFTMSSNEGMQTLSVTKEQLEAAGFLGTDGTVVGVEGGLTPFSLTPSSIAVTESQLKVDPEKKQLNVTLKVKAN